MSKDHEPNGARPEETGKPIPVSQPTASIEPNGDDSGIENPKPPLPPTPPSQP